jgi:hypothetical protein
LPGARIKELSMNENGAIALAQGALIWLAARPDEMGRLLAASGLDAADLRAGAGDPEFLGFVLDFLLGYEPNLVAFATAEGFDPAAIARARALLPGGRVPDWT